MSSINTNVDQSGIIDQDRTINATTFKVSTLDISALTDAAADGHFAAL